MISLLFCLTFSVFCCIYVYYFRYIEAQKANEELKRLTVKNQLPYDITNDFSMKKEHVYKTETRDQLVDLYCKTLPPITRQLATYTSNSTSLKQKSMFFLKNNAK